MDIRLSYLLLPPEFEEPHEPGVTWLAQLALDARDAARAWTARALADQQSDALRALLDHTRATCRDVWESLEDTGEGYTEAFQLERREAADRATYADWLYRWHAHLGFVGSDDPPRTWSHLGWIDDNVNRPLAFARDRGNVILASGIPGSGKTILSTLIGEGSFLASGTASALASPALLPTVYAFFHIEENDRLPQLLDGLSPNPTAPDLALLRERLGITGKGIDKLRLALPHWLMTTELMARLEPYKDLGLDVVELRVHLGEIGQPGLEAALGGDDGTRLAQRMMDNAQDQGQRLRTDAMHRFIDDAQDLDAGSRRKAHLRVSLLEQIEAREGEPGLWGLFEPGWATVVYLGGPHMGHGRVSPILVSLLSGLMMRSEKHGDFQRVIAVDEINLLARDDAAWRMFVKAGRLARHRGWTLILMGQDLLCVPDEMFGVAGLVAVFRQSSPQVFEHLRQRVGALRVFRWEDAAELPPGHALLTSLLSTSGQHALRVRFRPPLCMHGGYSRGMI